MSILIKVSYKQKIRRFPVDEHITYAALKDKLCTTFSVTDDDVELTYHYDSEDITFSSDEELQVAFAIAKRIVAASSSYMLPIRIASQSDMDVDVAAATATPAATPAAATAANTHRSALPPSPPPPPPPPHAPPPNVAPPPPPLPHIPTPPHMPPPPPHAAPSMPPMPPMPGMPGGPPLPMQMPMPMSMPMPAGATAGANPNIAPIMSGLSQFLTTLSNTLAQSATGVAATSVAHAANAASAAADASARATAGATVRGMGMGQTQMQTQTQTQGAQGEMHHWHNGRHRRAFHGGRHGGRRSGMHMHMESGTGGGNAPEAGNRATGSGAGAGAGGNANSNMGGMCSDWFSYVGPLMGMFAPFATAFASQGGASTSSAPAFGRLRDVTSETREAFETFKTALHTAEDHAAVREAGMTAVPIVLRWLGVHVGADATPIETSHIDSLATEVDECIRSVVPASVADAVANLLRTALRDAAVLDVLRSLPVDLVRAWETGHDDLGDDDRAMREAQQAGKVFSVHRLIECDGCGRKPIVGTRYMCSNRANYDLCQTCYDNDAVDKTGLTFRPLEYMWEFQLIDAKAPAAPLRPGSRGPGVAFLQKLLTDLGFMTGDMYRRRVGVYGNYTRDAVARFQTEYGLENGAERGLYDALTAASLLSIVETGGGNSGAGRAGASSSSSAAAPDAAMEQSAA